jgi:hypothetical protein
MKQGDPLEPSSSSFINSYPPFIEPQVSLPCSQQPATGSYPELHKSSPYPSRFLKIYFNIIITFMLRISKSSLHFRLPSVRCKISVRILCFTSRILFLKFHFNIITTFMLRISKLSLHFRLSNVGCTIRVCILCFTSRIWFCRLILKL